MADKDRPSRLPPRWVQFLRDEKGLQPEEIERLLCPAPGGSTPIPGRPPNKNTHPHEFIASWVRELHGFELDRVERLLRDRHGEQSIEMRLPAALVDLLALVLTEDDADDARRRECLQEFGAFRGRAGKSRRWTVDEIMNAASLVAHVRTCGYNSKDACDLVQKQKFPDLNGAGDAGALRRALNREKGKGVFVGIYFDRPSRMVAHAVLMDAGIDLPDDGPLSENQKFSWPFDSWPPSN